MASNNNNTYTVVKNPHGIDYLCPMHVKNNESDECFEKDVAERYSGNIDLEAD